MLNILAPIVPILVFLLSWDIFRKAQENWRLAFLSAAVVWGSLLTLITESLSLFKAISFWPILGAWGGSLGIALLTWRTGAGAGPPAVNFDPRWGSRFEIFLLGGMVLIASLVGLIAFVAPPNTWDSMTYHMARVMHWMQNKSVAHYPTHILRQLYLNPWSEFAILHFQVLAGTDRLANGIQWFSMVGSAIGVSCIADKLGADRRAQVFSAVVSMTIPMGILQGSSTQNDYVVAFWLACFTIWLLRLKEKGGFWNALACGASLGLAVLTKATAYIYALPFLIGLGFQILRRHGNRSLPLWSVIALMALAINLGHYLRNYDLFSNPLGLTQEEQIGHYTIQYRFFNEIFSVPVLLSNLIRNAAIHLGTPFAPLNLSLERGVAFLHERILGISPHDVRTTLPLGTKFQVAGDWFDEDSSGNFLHFVFVTGAIFTIGVKRDGKRTRMYILALIFAFLLFSLYLKWQPFNSRLQLPWFVLGSPLVGILFAGLQKRWIANVILAILFVSAVPWVLFNGARPLAKPQNIFNTPRTEQYFRNHHSLWISYSRAVLLLPDSQCGRIGLYLDLDSWEYPLWVLLYQKFGKGARIEAVKVENVSAEKYADLPPFTPCAVLGINPLAVDNFRFNDTAYGIYRGTKFVTILLPEPSSR